MAVDDGDPPNSQEALGVFGELRRRHVLQSAAAYLLAGFAVLQGADIVLPLLGAPDWGMKAIVTLVMLGFVTTLLVSWIFEWTGNGFKKHVDLDGSVQKANASSVLPIGLTLASVALFSTSMVLIWLPDEKRTPQPTPRTTESLPMDPSAVHPPEQPRVVVLPLRNSSNNESQNYIGDTMSEGIWNLLGTSNTLQLVAMTSARAAIQQSLTVDQISQRLNAHYIVEGSVRMIGELARVSVRVISAKNGSAIWNKQYSKGVETVNATFTLYDKIAADVANAFNVELGEIPSLAHRGTNNLNAKNYLDQAIYSYRTGDFAKVEPLVDLALISDDQYANAHFWKSIVLTGKANNGQTPASDALAKANTYNNRALELDPSFAPAYVQKAVLINRTQPDYRKSIRLIDKAEGLGNVVSYRTEKARMLAMNGRYEEALTLHQELAEIDPLFLSARLNSAFILNDLGRLDESMALLDELIGLAQNPLSFIEQKIRLSINNGLFDDAYGLIDDHPKLEFWRGYANLASGRGDKLYRAWLQKEAAKPNPQTWYVSYGYWKLGEIEPHLDWLDQLFEQRIGLDTVPRSLREAPEYWEKLKDWANEDDAVRSERIARVAAHRARVSAIEEKLKF